MNKDISKIKTVRAGANTYALVYALDGKWDPSTRFQHASKSAAKRASRGAAPGFHRTFESLAREIGVKATNQMIYGSNV